MIAGLVWPACARADASFTACLLVNLIDAEFSRVRAGLVTEILFFWAGETLLDRVP